MPARTASTVVLPISERGSPSSIWESFAARCASASREISIPGEMMPAEVFALVGDDVVGDRRAEVDDDARALEAGPGSDRVDQAVGAELARVVHPDRHAGLDPGADHEHLVLEVAARHLRPFAARARERSRRRGAR